MAVIGPSINIQKKNKYLNTASAEPVEILTHALAGADPVGRALRALINRLRHPDRALTDEEAEILLALSIAEIAQGPES